jgi:hypothetical protein
MEHRPKRGEKSPRRNRVGARHSNELRSASRARKIYLELAAIAEKWEVRPPAATQGAFKFASAGGQPTAAEHRCKASGNKQRSKPLTGEQRSEEFHRKNPGVYRWLLKAALQQLADGHKHGSTRNVVEQLRQDSGGLIIERDGPYKLDNSHIPFYSRLVMQNEVGLRGFFEIRELRTP